jgi:drug/metabolite transporter (DMT)-like permease
MNLADHKIAAAIGAVGIALVLGHVVLGRDVVPPPVALLGAGIAAVAALFVAIADRRRADRPGGSDGER